MSFLDELYYGNINPNENRNRKKLPYEKVVKTFVEYMKDLLARDIPSVDNSLFIIARKLILESR